MAGKKFSPLVVVLLIIVLLIVFGGFWYVSTRNRLVSQQQEIEGSWAEVENQLQRRYDLIPNLVETVKGYAAQEESIFVQIAEARSKLAGAGSVAETAEASNGLESALSRLLVVVEQYPELKSNENFIRLQDELAGTENRLAVARKRYNDVVLSFNREILMFPANMVAGNLGLVKQDYFEIDVAAKENPKVEF
ncbi:MAG: LemA family protein [Bacteroidetes bacterium]|nr:LemA family protein [Bacteroidota bacterium]